MAFLNLITRKLLLILEKSYDILTIFSMICFSSALGLHVFKSRKYGYRRRLSVRVGMYAVSLHLLFFFSCLLLTNSRGELPGSRPGFPALKLNNL